MELIKLKRVVASWSGGIDSTAVIACLLAQGYDVTAVTVDIYDDWTPQYAQREARAREYLLPVLEWIAETHGGRLEVEHIDGRFMREFAIGDSMAIPQRNKRIIDVLMSRYCIPKGIMNLAMGEYIGVDTWVVTNHVPPTDCDHRALSAYVYHEYGLNYRFMSLADFGESRYKSDRLALGAQHIGDSMSHTTNCMADVEVDCGVCYKCIERAAAFSMAGLEDNTVYASDPKDQPAIDTYLRQMAGYRVSADYSDFPQHQ